MIYTPKEARKQLVINGVPRRGWRIKYGALQNTYNVTIINCRYYSAETTLHAQLMRASEQLPFFIAVSGDGKPDNQ